MEEHRKVCNTAIVMDGVILAIGLMVGVTYAVIGVMTTLDTLLGAIPNILTITVSAIFVVETVTTVIADVIGATTAPTIDDSCAEDQLCRIVEHNLIAFTRSGVLTWIAWATYTAKLGGAGTLTDKVLLVEALISGGLAAVGFITLVVILFTDPSWMGAEYDYPC